MTPEELDPFFKGVAAVCAVLAIIWALRIKSKGSRAILMALAFLILGTTAMLYVNRSASLLINIGFGLTIGLLFMEFLVRTKTHADREDRK